MGWHTPKNESSMPHDPRTYMPGFYLPVISVLGLVICVLGLVGSAIFICRMKKFPLHDRLPFNSLSITACLICYWFPCSSNVFIVLLVPIVAISLPLRKSRCIRHCDGRCYDGRCYHRETDIFSQ